MANLAKRSNYVDPWRDFFDLDLWGNRGGRSVQAPAVNISEDDKCFCVDVVSPGFKKNDFKVDVEDDMLTISAETKHESKDGEKGKEYSRREYTYSSFTRSFRLPENVKADEVSAKYEDGILKINIPKAEERKKSAKQVNVD